MTTMKCSLLVKATCNCRAVSVQLPIVKLALFGPLNRKLTTDGLTRIRVRSLVLRPALQLQNNGRNAVDTNVTCL